VDWLVKNPHRWTPGATVVAALRQATAAELVERVIRGDADTVSTLEGEGYLLGNTTLSYAAEAADTAEREMRGSESTLGQVNASQVNAVLRAVDEAVLRYGQLHPGQEPSFNELRALVEAAVGTAAVQLATLPGQAGVLAGIGTLAALAQRAAGPAHHAYIT